MVVLYKWSFAQVATLKLSCTHWWTFYLNFTQSSSSKLDPETRKFGCKPISQIFFSFPAFFYLPRRRRAGTLGPNRPRLPIMKGNYVARVKNRGGNRMRPGSMPKGAKKSGAWVEWINNRGARFGKCLCGQFVTSRGRAGRRGLYWSKKKRSQHGNFCSRRADSWPVSSNPWLSAHWLITEDLDFHWYTSIFWHILRWEFADAVKYLGTLAGLTRKVLILCHEAVRDGKVIYILA